MTAVAAIDSFAVLSEKSSRKADLPSLSHRANPYLTRSLSVGSREAHGIKLKLAPTQWFVQGDDHLTPEHAFDPSRSAVFYFDAKNDRAEISRMRVVSAFVPCYGPARAARSAERALFVMEIE